MIKASMAINNLFSFILSSSTVPAHEQDQPPVMPEQLPTIN
jgi:hypothetical protein